VARKLTRFEKFGLIAAVLTGVLYFYLKHVYDPQQQALIQAREQLNQSITQFNELQIAVPAAQLRLLLESRQEALAKLEQELAGLDVRVGDEAALTRALHWTLQEMERQGLRVLNVAPQGMHKQQFNWQVFQITAQGDFRGLLDLLRELRTHNTPLRMEQVNVSRGDKPWPLKIVMNLWILVG
jgi:hypothetical protein